MQLWKKDIIATVLGWTPDLYPNLTDTKRTRYTHRELFFMVSVQHNINSK